MTQSPTDDGPSRPDPASQEDPDAAQTPPQPAPWPPRGYPPYPQSHNLALASLIVGIFGIVSLPLLGPVAWVLANQALQQIDAAPPGVWTNREHAVAGRIVGIIGTVLLALVTVLFLGIIGISVLIAVSAPAGG